jgi:hypothetical protein
MASPSSLAASWIPSMRMLVCGSMKVALGILSGPVMVGACEAAAHGEVERPPPGDLGAALGENGVGEPERDVPRHRQGEAWPLERDPARGVERDRRRGR